MNSIEVSNLSKKFRLYDQRYTSLKERVIHLGKVPSREFWALDNLNFEIKSGETVGILGRNGSGKSTLLKCLAGILKPTKGIVKIYGRLAAMLELGAGFHPELSGRDNIFLNGSLLGFGTKELERRFDDIVAYSGLEKFIDTQVKFYSSGMYARLGFAVAINVDPDILLIDEVLAVGDEAFQVKCLESVKAFQQAGKTILLVTHAPDTVRAIATRAIVMNEGKIIEDGDPGSAIRVFREEMAGDSSALGISKEDIPDEKKSQKLEFVSVESYPQLVDHAIKIQTGNSFSLKYNYRSSLSRVSVTLGLSIYDNRGDCLFSSDTESAGSDILVEREGFFLIEIKNVNLLDGRYPLSFVVKEKGSGEIIAWRDGLEAIEVTYNGKEQGRVKFDLKFLDQRFSGINADKISALEKS